MSWESLVDALRSSPEVPRLHSFSEVESTNKVASRLLAEGAVDGTVVVADRQTGGRGRAGRAWYSPAGAGVWLSVIRRLEWSPESASQVTLDVAVAVARAVEESTGLRPDLKWPNDLLLDGRKCGGILTELRLAPSAAGRPTIDGLIIGVGLDIHPLLDAPEDLASIAISLSEAAGRPLDRARCGRALVDAMGQGHRAMLARGRFDRSGWLKRSGMIGRWVQVTPPGAPTYRARVVALEASGALRVERGGVEELVIAGDVTLGPGE